MVLRPILFWQFSFLVNHLFHCYILVSTTSDSSLSILLITAIVTRDHVCPFSALAARLKFWIVWIIIQNVTYPRCNFHITVSVWKNRIMVYPVGSFIGDLPLPFLTRSVYLRHWSFIHLNSMRSFSALRSNGGKTRPPMPSRRPQRRFC